MSLLSKLKSIFRKERPAPEPLLSAEQQAELERALNPPKKPRGHVVRAKHAKDYNPNTKRTGGRIVKAMPRQLRHIKEAQEKIEE